MREFIRQVWCCIFHQRHHRRTGERRIRTVTINYDMVCDKCGNAEIVEVEYCPDLENYDTDDNHIS